MQEAIAAHLSERAGTSIRIVSATSREVLSSAKNRTFHLVRVRSEADGAEQLLHVRLTRWANRQRDRNRLDNYLSERGLPVPGFFGVVDCDGLVATLWEYCEGRTHRTYQTMPLEQADAVVRAMALISARATDVREAVAVPVGIRWVHPVADALMTLADIHETLAAQRPLIERLADEEHALIERIADYPDDVLVHNDLVARNTLEASDGGVRILDWDSAGIGPHGASLRAFTNAGLDRAQTVADIYVDEARRHGLALRPEDVLLTMRTQQLFWHLSSGQQRNDIKRIAKGLTLFGSSFPPTPSRGVKMAISESPSGEFPKPAPDSLKELVRQCMDKKGRNRLYSIIPHPDFAHLKASRGEDRFHLIKPQLPPGGGTALDLGAHFATFSHWLEDAGFKVTAVEHSPLYAQVAREVRDLNGKTFEVIEGSIFDLPAAHYNVILALNIFHHFLKTKNRFEAFEALLDRLRCDVMFFEAHVESEDQMKDAYRNMNPEEFARFIADRLGLNEITQLGHDKRRIVFKLAKT